ncbi:hypothetical protein CMQ_252 [Grosmannia clavigera kw1407]|uniref:Carbohydrate kinase PfkB domain-containing protein n=1 Tax=Grosmannia clavigera (strain kw1407 / UAMH 11150) TaxID=655863 RepID=F0XRA3_GROCL|nr:uncharacterized protein CMQ_252 [Grosmannia clavigera kw1407]EFW99934.1 hypothetical protein CMQ_252 [Grosmannia clavigera kw1407]
MRRLILTGACYLDTIISVPYYPTEDTKLRAASVQVRRGGNCPNTLEVLQQLVGAEPDEAVSGSSSGRDVRAYLVSCLPAADAAATQTILASLGGPSSPFLCFDHCLYRDGFQAPASCYILRSAATGSRTSVNDNRLPEMTADEFAGVVAAVGASSDPAWWHFEGRIADVTLACIGHVHQARQADVVVSVEIENPDRQGLRALAAEADVVFYSKLWAQGQGYADAEACLRGEAASLRQASVGAGDTFVAGILYRLVCHREEAASEAAGDGLQPATTWNLDDASVQEALAFAVDLATRKVQMDGFRGLVAQTS